MDVGWRAVTESLVAGIAHDLNARLMALTGAAYVARSGRADEELAGTLQAEAARIERCVRLLRALPVGPPGAPELIRLTDLLSELAGLFAERAGPTPPHIQVAGDPDALIRISRTALAELVLLAIAGAEARSAAGTGAITVDYRTEGDDVVLCVAGGAAPPAAEDGGWGRRGLDRVTVTAAAHKAAQRLGAALDADAPADRRAPARFTIRLPGVTP